MSDPNTSPGPREEEDENFDDTLVTDERSGAANTDEDAAVGDEVDDDEDLGARGNEPLEGI